LDTSTTAYKNIYTTALNYLATRDFSVSRMRTKLTTLPQRYPKSKRYKDYSPANIEQVLKDLIRLDLLNDERSARHVIEISLRGKFGLRRVRMNLIRQDYPKLLVDELIKECEEGKPERDLTMIVAIIKNKKRQLTKRYEGDKQKLYSIKNRLMQQLAQGGFNFDEIKEILSKLED